MNIGLLIPSIIFGLIGLAIILYLLKVIIGALVGNPFGWLEKHRFSRRLRLLAQGDEFFRAGDSDSAITAWQGALFLDRIRSINSLVDSIGNHNLTVLGRLVSLSEKRNCHLSSLPVVEGLLSSRIDLMRAHFEVRDTLNKLRLKQKNNKKSGSSSAPDWALTEFSKKLSEINDKIEANSQALKAQLSQLFVDIKKISTSNEITYH